MKKTFFESLSGGYAPGAFLGFLFWALIGAYILINIHAQTRDPRSCRTPMKFSWTVWIRDNARRVLFNLVLIIVTIRFSLEVTGSKITDFWALVIGLSSDLLAIILNNLRLIKLIGTLNPKKEE